MSNRWMGLGLVLAVTAVAQPTDTLDAYRQSFVQHQQQLLAQYDKALDALPPSLKMKGDLDSLLLVEAEQKRFAARQTEPAPAEAKPLFSAAAVAYHQAMQKLLGQYVAALEGLIRQKVTADRIDEAKVIKAEKDKAAALLADTRKKLPEAPKPTAFEKAGLPRTVATHLARIAPAETTFIEAVNFVGGKNRDGHAWVRIKNQRKEVPEHILAGPSNNRVFDVRMKDFERNSPSVQYPTLFAQEGKYYLWILAQGEAGGASVAVGLDGALLKPQIVGFFPYHFAWIGRFQSGERIELNITKAGPHTIELYMCEDGLRVARLAVTDDAGYSPPPGLTP